MIAALRYEWRRLWTIRSTYWLIGLTLTIQTLFTFVAAWGAQAGDAFDPEEVVSQIITLGASFGYSPLITAYIIAMFGVFSFGHEYRYGMIRATLTAVPDRTAVFMAKVVVTSLLAGVLSLACCLIGMFNALLFLDTDGVLSGRGVWTVVLGATLYTMLFGLCGLAVAGLVRNQTGALALILLFPLVIENVLGVILRLVSNLADNNVDAIAKVFPFDAGAQMFARPSAQLINDVLGYEPFGAVTGGLIMLAFTAGLLAGAHTLFRRRDA